MKLKNFKIEFGRGKIFNDRIEMRSPTATPNLRSSQGSVTVVKEKFSSGRFAEEFDKTHFVGTENAGFAIISKLFEKLPTESSFTSGRGCANDVKPGRKNLKIVEIVKAGGTIGEGFIFFNFGQKEIGERIDKIQRFLNIGRMVQRS